MLRTELDQPVELRLRGDTVDVLGAMMALLALGLEDGTDNDRADSVIEDLSNELNRQVNFGHWKREVAKALNDDTIPDYRGIQVLVDEFDAQHPEPAGDGVAQLTPLDEAEFYAIVSRTPEGFEFAGWPEQMSPERHLQLASLLRMHARDIEGIVAEGRIDELPGGDDDR